MKNSSFNINDYRILWSDEYYHPHIIGIEDSTKNVKCEGITSRKINSDDNNLTAHGNDTYCSVREKRYKCTICNRGFSRNEHLKRHHRVHSGERPYRCPFNGCEKSFARNDNLNAHIKIIHSQSNHEKNLNNQ